MKIDKVTVNYVPSDQRNFQGIQGELDAMLNQGWQIVPDHGGNGTYFLFKPTKVYMYFYVNGVHKSFEVKELIKKYYNAKKIYKGLATQLQEDIISGNATVEYNESNNSVSIK